MVNKNYRTKRKILAILLTCMLGWGLTYTGTVLFRQYAIGLFIYLPIVMGAVVTMLYGYKNEVTRSGARRTAFEMLGYYGLGLLGFAAEGGICILMAAPIGLFCTWLGYLIGYSVIMRRTDHNAPSAMILLILSVPAVMTVESGTRMKENVRSVTTRIEIEADPQEVWENVIAFPELDAPTELLFKAGIAYPVSATIEGQGAGAIRYCHFSTGSFVEPITVWDEPHLLRFDVADQPEPLKEISPYDIHPNHLHGYWVSRKGQFKLTPLPNGHTLLEGTTWYTNKIKPDFYWNLWSDNIVHAIHRRVLRHIKVQSESAKMK